MATEGGQEQGGNEHGGQEPGGNSWNGIYNSSVGVVINCLITGNMRLGDINAMGGNESGNQGGSG